RGEFRTNRRCRLISSARKTSCDQDPFKVRSDGRRPPTPRELFPWFQDSAPIKRLPNGNRRESFSCFRERNPIQSAGNLTTVSLGVGGLSSTLLLKRLWS